MVTDWLSRQLKQRPTVAQSVFVLGLYLSTIVTSGCVNCSTTGP
ncbi:hypothetical protein [Halorussus caseinilyticus]|uniref:Uncharacterized protein n=1 Tax=Halorussus caseinilyticus TaxID=3034025 RepID=A0ABD5WSV6_9EURY|nr:hypothetical protein [Halorussus sp. DT72]